MPWHRYLTSGDPLDRRAFLRLAGAGGLGLAGLRWLPAPAFAAVDPAAVTRMEIAVTYRTEVRNLPGDTRELHLWMPLPPDDARQEVHDLEVHTPLAYTIERDPLFGNRMVHVASGREPESFAVESRYRVVRHRLGPQQGQLDAAAAQKYLRLTGRLRVTDEIEGFTRRCVGKATAPREVARRVYDGLIDYLTYDKEIPGCGTGDTEWVMRHRRGKCDDYHALLTAILRSRGIPVRWEQGFPLPYPTDGAMASGQLSGDCSGAHCWVSFYDPELGWVPVDMSEGDKHPELHDFFFGHLTPNRFQVSEGRSLSLAPPQGGGPLPTFAYAYVEADGIPLIYKANYDNLVQYRVTRVETA